MLRTSLATLALLAGALATPALAGDCSTLAVTADEDSIAVDITGGLADAPAFLVVGDTTGTTAFDFGPLGSLTLGLVQPFALFPVGSTDAAGALSLSFPNNGNAPDVDLFAQAVTVGFTLNVPPIPGELPVSLEFCTSNVAAFSL